MANTNSICWFEIPVSDLDKAKVFYETVLKTKLDRQDDGPNPMLNFPIADYNGGVSGHLYPGKPAQAGSGPTIHLIVPDDGLEATLARVEPAGGKIVSPVITIPPGRFAYCTDPDGNSLGLFSRQ